MKLAVGEISHFFKLEPGENFQIELVAGKLRIDGLNKKIITALQSNTDYLDEILNALFINREIIWQPNVYNNIDVCITNLNVFSVFAEEELEKISHNKPSASFYKKVYNFLIEKCKESITVFSNAKTQINADDQAANIKPSSQDTIQAILGIFRKEVLPVIKVFIELSPDGRLAKRQALHRMDFAIEVVINQYNLKYSDIINPYWEIIRKPMSETNESNEEKTDKTSAPDDNKKPGEETTPPKQAKGEEIAKKRQSTPGLDH